MKHIRPVHLRAAELRAVAIIANFQHAALDVIGITGEKELIGIESVNIGPDLPPTGPADWLDTAQGVPPTPIETELAVRMATKAGTRPEDQ
jgi:hypothetical protein